MAWVKERITDDGDKGFVACYRDPEGRQRSAGTFSSRRAAERAGNREEAKVREGAWNDHSRGVVTFAEYVETVWLPSNHVETSTQPQPLLKRARGRGWTSSSPMTPQEQTASRQPCPRRR